MCSLFGTRVVSTGACSLGVPGQRCTYSSARMS
jgi:hypothetical protein